MTLNDFYRRQLASWQLAADNYKALFNVRTRTLHPADNAGEMPFTLQFNPARVRSTAAVVDRKAITARPCFLCAHNRPENQLILEPARISPDLSSRCLSEEYEILLNPYPIFPCHFTIPVKNHSPQVICADGCRRFGDMLILAKAMEGMALFYNGARCGASAPDHFHFQAIPLGAATLLTTEKSIPFLTFGYETADKDEMIGWFTRAVVQSRNLPLPSDHDENEMEPRMNIWCAYSGDTWKTVVIPRRAHRPDFYGSGEGRFMVSPASVDLGGTVVLPSPHDFENFTSGFLTDMLSQTTYPIHHGRGGV